MRPAQRFDDACYALKFPTFEDIKKKDKLKMPTRPADISVDDWNIIKAQYMQSTVGDADTSEPSNILGLNEKKKREWQAWNSIRGVS